MDSEKHGTENLGALHGSSLKPVEELTEYERFAIASAAGVGIDSMEWCEDGCKIKLKPSSIAIVNGEYVVYSKR